MGCAVMSGFWGCEGWMEKDPERENVFRLFSVQS